MGEPFLFFGIRLRRPERDAVEALRVRLGLDRGYAADRLHITVRALGLLRLLGDDAVAAACAAAGSLVHPPFRVVFDRVEDGVLRGSEPIRGLLAFERALADALAAFGRLGRRSGPFRPHVTLVYGGASGRVRIDPISWRVEEFTLIASMQGDGRHAVIARWRLRG